MVHLALWVKEYFATEVIKLSSAAVCNYFLELIISGLSLHVERVRGKKALGLSVESIVQCACPVP